jgi:putative DNA primase/helicase
MLVGEGRNGKGTLLDIVTEVLGRDYCTEAATSSFLYDKSGANRMRSDLATIADKRLVKIDEINEGARLDEALIRKLTGGGRMVAARKYENECEYRWRGKMWFLVNHKPKIRDKTAAIWERLVLVETPARTVPHDLRDNRREEIPLKEGAAVAAWLMRCVDEYVTNGIYLPKQVRDAVSEYRDDNDVVSRFLQENTAPSGVCIAAELYGTYKSWSHAQGERFVATQHEFEERLARLGHDRQDKNGITIWEGLSLSNLGDY